VTPQLVVDDPNRGLMRKSYDAVVVGSGFGGSITACRLAQAGRSVCVLERGRRWGAVDFPRSPSQIARDAFWDPPAGRYGIIEYRGFRGMHVLSGSGVGGGSLHYFNVHLRPPASVFADPRWPPGIDRGSLAPYYALAADMLDVAPLSPPSGRVLPTRTTAFLEACRRAGRTPELVDIAVYTGPGRINRHGIPQLPCDYSGNCFIGCATQAKNTLDVNYLALAEHHGAEVHPLHRVDVIGRRRGGYRVTFTRIDPRPGGGGEVGRVDADSVIVAAGTLGTNELLLRCRDQHRSLPALSPALGKGFGSNGDFLLGGTLTDDDIDGGRGPSITAGADFSTTGRQVYVEDLGYPDPLLWFIEGMLANATPTLNVIRWAKLFLKGRLGISGATARISQERERLFGGGRTRGLLPYLGMCEDAADGELVLDEDGNLDLRWDPAASLDSFLELEEAIRELSRALDGEYVPNPFWSAPPVRELLTAHPLGGCLMGDDGVVDAFGEVRAYPGLFVVDGSLVPTSLARNPTATISALAERAAFHMIHGRELQLDDAATPSNGSSTHLGPRVEPAPVTAGGTLT
jgi:cholesterol oxidase